MMVERVQVVSREDSGKCSAHRSDELVTEDVTIIKPFFHGLQILFFSSA